MPVTRRSFLTLTALAVPALAARRVRAAELPRMPVDGAAVAGIVTEWRRWIGHGAVYWDEAITASAADKAASMAVCDYVSHDSAHPICPAPWPALHNGECLGAGLQSWIEVLLAWQNSPGHYATLRDPAFTRIGMAGVVDSGDALRYTYYWCLRLAA